MPLLQAQPHSHGLGAHAPEQSRAERLVSFDAADFAVPTGREEEWRFTPVDRLRMLLDGFGVAGTLAEDHAVPAGVLLERLAADDPVRSLVPPPADRAAVLAHQNAADPLRVVVPAETVLTEPVRLRFTGSGGQAAGHVVVELGPYAQATVILDYAGSAAYGELVSVTVQDGARLTLVTFQEWSDDAVHVSQHDVVVGKDAVAKHVAVTLGGRIVRISTNATYTGPGGSFEGYGVYFADAGQHQEHRLFVDHGAPHCSSNVLYKGALHGDNAHSVWVGDVLIRAEAEGTDTYEQNRNLLLTEGARADSVPNLEIETGEIVGAGHASASGRFDDEQLFYLMARGIPHDIARRLVVRGFFADVVNRIGLPDLQAGIMTAIEAELGYGPDGTPAEDER